MQRPFRFGVQASNAPAGSSWKDFARKVESLGYATLTMPDHFGDQLAPIPALMAAADATETLRVGALVWDNDYRHPVVLAKELATIDVLSGGRLQIGIGAGWLATDYAQSGITYDSNKVRVDRFEEALIVLKRAMSGEQFSFDGAHYTITDHAGAPRPVQSPHPPILIGAGGRRMLSIAAREADIVGINGTLSAGAVGPEAVASMTAQAVDEKVAVVRAHAGDRLDTLELNIRAFIVRVTPERTAAMDQVAGFVGVEPSFVEESPFALIGTPAQLVDDLLRRRERWGFSDVIVGAEDAEPFAPVVAELAGR
ncbi:MAG TPA: TIGR03621 family F420-dependent LLM class oxidoreductase [Ilumatobacteraceae bacterium]|nr:TIGR03621 family F420-dependent LLM class oxidoreductase [Ilumatobacteraceae bacterium]